MGNIKIMDIIAIAGFAITVLGFAITIWQVLLAKKLSKSAYIAAKEAQTEIKNSIILSDIKTSIKLLQEIKDYIRDGKLEIARLRIEDLIISLIQLRQLLINIKQSSKKITEIIIQLRSICNNIEEVNFKMKDTLNSTKINRSLSSYLDILSDMSSKIIFPINNGGK